MIHRIQISYFCIIFLFLYTRFLSYELSLKAKGLLVGYAIMIIGIIRKIIINYDEPAKTSEGEVVARYGYGRTERPCGRLTSDPWR